ncbi:TRCF domain-containing protein [Methylobacterium nodulans]|uniref:Transcription-repair-coupling factor n=1 Tax=Methylobacterium nodulans (strain LMG 21967 / CNCM I-2342 / ORS 2060) TaxID=460265 RepID=B8IPT9_METNO|nr:TRCF domain-containing protein [Methylobacterium nodulans]ACL56589.1 DEAD/DEAH box helicase domain protein [Methylobacterium nodulans ORS 2060]
MVKHRRRVAVGESAAEIIAPAIPSGALAVALIGLAETAAPLVFLARDGRRLDEIAAILRSLAPARQVAVYPEWDCLPGDRTSPSRGTMGARAGVLRWLADTAHRPDLLLSTAPALIQRVPPPEIWAEARVALRVGDGFEAASLTAALTRLGYILDERVDEPGEIAVRGRTLEVFPAAAPRPCRIEHEDGRITAIRSYDPVTQRSVADAAELVIDPATELILGPDAPEPLAPFTGQEHRLPRFYPRLATVLDALPGARLVVEAGAEARAAAFFEQVTEGSAAGEAHPADARLYLTPPEWSDVLDRHRFASADAIGDVAVPAFVRERRPAAAFGRFLTERLRAGDRVLLTGPPGPLRRLAREAVDQLGHKLLRARSWACVLAAEPGQVAVLEAPIGAGFRVPEAEVTVVAAADLLGLRAAPAQGDAAAALPFGEIDLHRGDVAIHEDHGLCVFEGLEPVGGPDGEAEEAARLRFADDAVLLAPLSQADRIWRYGSAAEAVSLDRLDGGTWEKRRATVAAAVAATARRMLDLAETRRRARAEPLIPPDRQMERFCAGFGFSLTPDQAAAIDAVLEDLAAGRPMDRLVCGDVGFGKTEVALRAAAAALFAGRQVALAAPTTVLVRQHTETFRRRFARFGIVPAQLSRLTPPAEAKRVKAGLAEGSVRLVIGTHALAGRGVRMPDLGLVIIDEEQRFGTAQKERLRRAARGAHVLTLTATPIPRTLQTALVGLQDLSVIATPPVVRQPIRTVIAPFAPDTVRAALMREHRRGGQSFVVCPRIADLAPMEAQLRSIVPELTIALAHGELPPDTMDEAMVRFAAGEGDVLLATNIIESGLDVPRANTMLVWHPERFGLAQLHQLRGRVGRGQRRAAAYLLTDPQARLPAASEKRLRTLAALDRLGAGFALSARDLDLRGAGDLFGEDQAGHVKLIGLDLYRDLLERAVRAARGEPDEAAPAEIRLGLAGRIPQEYVPEPELRLSLCARLARLRTADEAEALRDEIEDRFGPLPPEVDTLLTLARLRAACRDLGIARLSAGPQGLAADFEPGRVEAVARAVDGVVRRGDRLILHRPCADPAECGRLAARFLRALEAAPA